MSSLDLSPILFVRSLPPSFPPPPQTIETACNDVKSSVRLRQMLKCVLSVGNRVNRADHSDHVRRPGQGGGR